MVLFLVNNDFHFLIQIGHQTLVFLVFLFQNFELAELVLVQLLDIQIKMAHSLSNMVQFVQLRLLQLLFNVFFD